MREELQDDVLNVEALESELQALQGNIEPPSPQPLQTSEQNTPGGATAGENTTASTVSKVRELEANPNQGDSNTHDKPHEPMVDPKEAGAAELAQLPNVEGNTLIVAAKELSREFSPNRKRFMLTYHSRIDRG